MRKRIKREKVREQREKKGEDIKTKSELVRERKKEVVPNSGKEAPYPLVLSKKDKERYFARFLDIFKKVGNYYSLWGSLTTYATVH